jgi:hypothetical protein
MNRKRTEPLLLSGQGLCERTQPKAFQDALETKSTEQVVQQATKAKDKAIDHLRLIAKGVDPKEQRDNNRRAEGSRLFGEFAEEWRQTFETGLKHQAARRKLKRIVQVICKPLHKLRLDEIETAHVVDVLKTVWHQREVSRDTRQRIKQIMDAAIAHNLRTTCRRRA